jgi:hypothetical protein
LLKGFLMLEFLSSIAMVCLSASRAVMMAAEKSSVNAV